MHYYISSLARYSREPDRFINTARNILRSNSVDTYVVSWPKTGRTWLRVLLGKALANITSNSEGNVLDTYGLSKPASCDTVMFSHGGRFHLFDKSHFESLQFNNRVFSRKKVVFLTRDIRDTLVSSYFQESKRSKIFKGEINDFVKDPQLGARKIVGYYNLWYENRSEVQNFHSVTYELLHKDPVGELGALLEFIGLENTDIGQLQEAVNYADFSNMKQLESSGTLQDSVLRPGHQNDAESSKVRRGKVGGFVNYLDNETQEYIERIVDEMGIKSCNWYFAS